MPTTAQAMGVGVLLLRAPRQGAQSQPLLQYGTSGFRNYHSSAGAGTPMLKAREPAAGATGLSLSGSGSADSGPEVSIER